MTAMKNPPTSRPSHAARTDSLDRLAWLMDSVITIPGTNIRLGLDALLGLIPGLGDVGTGLIQVGLVLFAVQRYKLPKSVAIRMASNVLLDVGVGAIPFLGDAFDVFFKANTRNMKLLREVTDQRDRDVSAVEPLDSRPALEGRAGKKSRGGSYSPRILLLIGGVLGAALLLVLIGFIALVVWLSGRPLI